MATAQQSAPTIDTGRRRFGVGQIVGLVVLVVVVVAMIASTKFLTPTELANSLPKPFDPVGTASELYTKAKADVPSKAGELGQVLTAIQDDPQTAAKTYAAVSPSENEYVFAVKTTATVTQASDANLRLNVPGSPSGSTVIVPLSTAVNGSTLRDYMGFKFADAPGQTDYQYVSDELKKQIQADLKTQVSNPTSLEGKKVDVVGVIDVPTTNGAAPPVAKPVNIQPISVEVGS